MNTRELALVMILGALGYGIWYVWSGKVYSDAFTSAFGLTGPQ